LVATKGTKGRKQHDKRLIQRRFQMVPQDGGEVANSGQQDKGFDSIQELEKRVGWLLHLDYLLDTGWVLLPLSFLISVIASWLRLGFN